jgi:hypothetical protein
MSTIFSINESSLPNLLIYMYISNVGQAMLLKGRLKLKHGRDARTSRGYGVVNQRSRILPSLIW